MQSSLFMSSILSPPKDPCDALDAVVAADSPCSPGLLNPG